MGDKPVWGTFFCTCEKNVGRRFPHYVRIPIRLRMIEMVAGVPTLAEKQEHMFVCVTMEQRSGVLFEEEDAIYYWEISGLNEIEIIEEGVKYAKAIFQMEEYIKVLILLKKECEGQNVGRRFWRLSKIWRFIAEAKYAIGVIESEVAYAYTVVGSNEPTKAVNLFSKLGNELRDTKVELERKKGNLESQSHSIGFFYFIFGTVFGLIVSVLLKYIV
jgi:hypothetical protein